MSTGQYRLWTEQGFADDGWTHHSEGELPEGKVILSLGDYLALEEIFRHSNETRLAVELKPADRVEDILPFLDRLPLVALAFPAFNDGRSFSKAELLRRHGYKGLIRATGDVLIDQVPLMLRCGFDEFEVSNETALRRLEQGHLGGIPIHYQPAARTVAGRSTYSWRRKPAA